jgi:tRNA pseudouridine38-40 synthase
MQKDEHSLTRGQPKRRLRFIVSYDGTDYLGWQYQPQGPTIQGVCQEALGKILGEEIKVIGAGRTDSGVHALGQAAHFDTFSKLPCAAMERALNAGLPFDIRVRSFAEADSSFHARYSARSRLYRYNIVDIALPEAPILMRTSWVRRTDIDFGLLEECAGLLSGEHDFYTFSKKGGNKSSHLCRVASAVWKKDPGYLTFEISADRFLHGMVRMLIGGMVAVAEGRAEKKDFFAALNMPGRWLRAEPAPACGLFLMHVEY